MAHQRESTTVAVLGASGAQHQIAQAMARVCATGLLFIREALASSTPIEIVAYVRTPSKIPADLAQRIKIVQGGLRDADALGQALRGVDIVVSFLGPSDVSLGTLTKAFTRDFSAPIADAIREVVIPTAAAKGVKRLFLLGTASYELPAEKGKVTFPLRFARGLLYYCMPTGYAEMHGIGKAAEAAQNALNSSEFDIVLFRVPFLYDEKPNSPVKSVDTGRFGGGYKGGTFLSRQNIARWIVSEIREKKHHGIVSIGELP